MTEGTTPTATVAGIRCVGSGGVEREINRHKGWNRLAGTKHSERVGGSERVPVENVERPGGAAGRSQRTARGGSRGNDPPLIDLPVLP